MRGLLGRIAVTAVAAQPTTALLRPRARDHRRGLHPALQRLALLASGLVIAALLCEALARLIVPLPWGLPVGEMSNLVRVAWTEGAFVRDAELGYRPAANFHGRMVRRGEYDAQFRTNSLGLRNRELAPRDGLSRRLLVVGDSFAFGMGVAQSEPFPRVLEAGMRTAGLPTEVVNGGVVGYGIDQYDGWLARLMPRVKPDLVILALFAGNDFHEYQRSGQPPIERSQRVQDGYLVPNEGPLGSWLMRHTTMGFLLGERRHWLSAHVDALLGHDPFSIPIPDLSTARPYLQDIASRVAARGVPLGIVILPDRHQLRDLEHSSAPPARRALYSRWAARLNQSQAVVAQLAAVTTRAPILDLTRELAGSDIHDVYFPRDGHMTPYGHRLVAAHLERWLAAEFPAERRLARF